MSEIRDWREPLRARLYWWALDHLESVALWLHKLNKKRKAFQNARM